MKEVICGALLFIGGALFGVGIAYELAWREIKDIFENGGSGRGDG